MTPCRIVDTRQTGQYLHAQQAMNFTIAGQCGIPANVPAFSLNITAIPRTRSLNFLTVWPAGEQQPATSTLNAPTGAITANAALVQDGTDGQISVYAYDDADLLVDTNGYFAAPGQTNQLSLYPVTPCRALDTRPNYFINQMTVQMESSPCSLPSEALAYVVNATVLPQTQLGFLTLWGQGEQPLVSTLNAYDGAVTSNLAIVPSNPSNGTLLAFASDNTQLLIDVFSFVAPPVAISNTSLPAGVVNQSYQAQLMGTGGLPPYTWSITSGSLPTGLSLDSTTGAIMGTPSQTGSFRLPRRSPIAGTTPLRRN